MASVLELSKSIVKALLEVEANVLIQQQQLLYNGNEMRNSDKLSALGVKDNDLLMMMVSNASAATVVALGYICIGPWIRFDLTFISIGVVSGKDIFGPPLDQYWKEKLGGEEAVA